MGRIEPGGLSSAGGAEIMLNGEVGIVGICHICHRGLRPIPSCPISCHNRSASAVSRVRTRRRLAHHVRPLLHCVHPLLQLHRPILCYIRIDAPFKFLSYCYRSPEHRTDNLGDDEKDKKDPNDLVPLDLCGIHVKLSITSD